MDLHAVFFILLQQLFLLSISSFQETQGVQHPTSKYAHVLNAKEAKEELKRRRKHVRQRENISLKPPPEDWPQPAFGAGDFLEEDPPHTSHSPLRAYQAKLEQELIRQKEEEEQNKMREIENPPKESQLWTSSEEDFKKLLDPGELLKHNKQLKSYVKQGTSQKTGKKEKTADRRGNKESRPPEIRSMTALKASTGSKKAKRKSKSSVAKVTTKSPSRRGRKWKDVQKEFMEDLAPLKELKKRKVKPTEIVTEFPKTKKRPGKVRKFAFATEYSKEYDTERQTKESILSRTKFGQSENFSTFTESSPVTTRTTSKGTFMPVETTTKLELQGITRMLTTSISRKCTKQLDSSLTNQTFIEISSTTEKTLISKTSSFTTLTPFTETAVVPTYTTLNKKNVIREKRKQMKQEMERVIKEEELDGSFNDTDADWTTSERGKIPILSVTPRHAVLSLLKYKIVDLLETILKENPKKGDER